jgi:hypothetical protein
VLWPGVQSTHLLTLTYLTTTRYQLYTQGLALARGTEAVVPAWRLRHQLGARGSRSWRFLEYLGSCFKVPPGPPFALWEVSDFCFSLTFLVLPEASHLPARA